MKKYVSLFGSMFSRISIQRFDENDQPLQTLKVPVSYGPKERYLVRITTDPDFQRTIDQVLPRMSFVITSFTYDASRKMNTMNKSVQPLPNSSKSQKSQYAPVPYNIGFQLSILVRNAEDGAQIIEQILPYFTPDWTISDVTLIPEMLEKKDIPVILSSVNIEDNYDVDFNTKRAIIWTLNFEMKAFFYGPIHTSAIILDANTNFFANATVPGNSAVSTTEVLPGLTANGQPTANASLSIPAAQISANSDFGYIINTTTQ